MLIAAFVLAANLSLFHRTPPSPAPTCGIQTVSYRFVGEPGTEFVYGGNTYIVPASGWIELLAKRKPANYLVAGRALPLDVWPRDDFGTRHVPLPKYNSTRTEATTVAGGIR